MRHISRKIILVIALAITIFLALNFFQKDVKNAVYLISSPFQKIMWGLGSRTSDFFNAIYRLRGLNQEREILERKNQELLSRIADLEEMEEENKVLREALKIDSEKDFKDFGLVLARIVNSQDRSDFILVDKGSQDQISAGMPVINSQKALAGEVSEVYENFSRIKLISHPESAFSAKVRGEKDIRGIVQGEGRLTISLVRLPQDKEIFKGDVVVTDGRDGRLPAGLLVGEVKEIKKSDIQTFQTAQLSAFFDITKEFRVFIIAEPRFIGK